MCVRSTSVEYMHDCICGVFVYDCSYQLNIDYITIFYVSPMVITKKTPIEDCSKENNKGNKACHCEKKN